MNGSSASPSCLSIPEEDRSHNLVYVRDNAKLKRKIRMTRHVIHSCSEKKNALVVGYIAIGKGRRTSWGAKYFDVSSGTPRGCLCPLDVRLILAQADGGMSGGAVMSVLVLVLIFFSKSIARSRSGLLKKVQQG